MDLSKPILVTGASGKTGRRAVAAIVKAGGRVRAMVRRAQAGDELKQAGAAEIAMGDLTDADALRGALKGAGQVLHICPPMHPKEDAIAHSLIGLARDEAVGRIVLYSVLHPLMEDVPHHARKLIAERHLVESDLRYTILQPGRYMQHLAPMWKRVTNDLVHDMPFSTKSRFSVADLDDLADVCAIVTTQDGHDGATYQLAGPEPLNQEDMAAILSGILGKTIRAEAKPLETFRRDAQAASIPEERLKTMLAMNAHYDRQGLVGNPNVMRWLLGREPTRYPDFVKREFIKG